MIKIFIFKLGNLIKKCLDIANSTKNIIINFIKNFTNKVVKLQNILKKLNFILALPLIYFIKFILFVRIIRFSIINKQWILNSYFVEYLDFKNELFTFFNNFSLIYNYSDLFIIINKNFNVYLIVLSIITLSIFLLILIFFNILIPLKYYLVRFFENKFSNLEEKYISLKLLINITKIIKFSISIISYIISYIIAWELINLILNNNNNLFELGVKKNKAFFDYPPIKPEGNTPPTPPSTPEPGCERFRTKWEINSVNLNTREQYYELWKKFKPNAAPLAPKQPLILKNLPVWDDDPNNTFLNQRIEFASWVGLDQNSRVTFLRQKFYRGLLIGGEDVHPLTIVKMSNTLARFEFANPDCTSAQIIKYLDEQIHKCDMLQRDNLLKTQTFVRTIPFLKHIDTSKNITNFPVIENGFWLRNKTISYQTEFLM